MKKKLNVTIVIIILLVTNAITCMVTHSISYRLGQMNADAGLLSQLASRIEEVKAFTTKVSQLTKNNENMGIELEECQKIIGEYEAYEKLTSEVYNIEDIKVNIYKSYNVKIESEQKLPWNIFSEKIQLNPELVGYMVDGHEEITATYYLGAVAAKIREEAKDGAIYITYGKDAFMTPYIINSRTMTLNTSGKIITSAADADVEKVVNTVGELRLSDAEDEYIQELKKQYHDSQVSIYVNGVNLNDWAENDKLFTANHELDSVYSVEELN